VIIIFSSEKDKKYFRRGDLEKQKADEYRRKQEVGSCFCLSTLTDYLITILTIRLALLLYGQLLSLECF
jgi:hypothetical protein